MCIPKTSATLANQIQFNEQSSGKRKTKACKRAAEPTRENAVDQGAAGAESRSRASGTGQFARRRTEPRGGPPKPEIGPLQTKSKKGPKPLGSGLATQHSDQFGEEQLISQFRFGETKAFGKVKGR